MSEYLSSEPPKNIPRETIRGTLWGYLSFASGKLLNFIATLILARLLVPEQFGLVAYCTIIIQYLDIINSAGINSALIARKEKLEEATNAALAINLVMGVVSFGIAWLIAPLVAEFFHEEKITDLFRLLAFALPLDGLGLVPDALIQRNLRFRDKLIPDISRNIIKGLISIILALLGWGPLSLIWGQIAGSAIGVLLSWMLAGWRPSLKFDWQTTREMMSYGTHIIVVGFAGALRANVDYIVVGRILGAASLGLYTMAYRIPELAIRSLNDVVARILFPLLSRTQSNLDTLRAFYLNYIRYVSLFSFSIGLGLALTSNLFVDKFMSIKWEPAVIPMSLISIALAISSVGHAPGVLYKSINRPEILSWTSVVKLPFIIALLIFCSRWGINGVAIGQIIFAVFSVALDSFIVSRVINLRFVEFLNALAPSVISSGVMALVVGLIRIIFEPAGWLGLGIEVVGGVFVFIATLILFSGDTVLQITSTLRKELSGS
jgi:O-antigen/teichoic acid export membrane protein